MTTAGLAAATLLSSAWAKVETWRQEGPTAFAKARREGVVISEHGRVRLGHSVSTFGTLSAERVWDLARDRAGTLYAATGDNGKVFRREPRPEAPWTVAYDSSDSQALALVVGPDGTVYVGTGPTGQVVNITDAAHPASRPSPKVQYIWDLAADANGNLYAATGPNGQLWKRARDGKWSLLYDSKANKALVIFPFEEQFYRERGVDAIFVGHPLAELPSPTTERSDYAAQFHLDPAKLWITVMPGSRVKEVRMNLPTILESAAQLGSDYEFLLPVAPTLDRSFLQNLIGQRKITLVPDALPALWHSRAGIVASGTATVEAAMMNTPFVMVYCVSSLTYLLGKPRVRVPHFAMVNLIAGEQVVPELVQHDFTAGNVVARLKEVLPDGPPRERMLTGLARVKERLRAARADSEAVQHPADRAAEIIISLLPKC